jgi:plastocyanin
MSHRLLRTAALMSAIVLSGLLGAACDGQMNANQSTGAGARAGTTPEGGTSVSSGTQQIEMADDVFQPVLLTVAAGTKVTWVNKGSKAHTVVSNEKLFDSGLVNVGGEFSHTFDAPGTYSYHCAPHAKMIGQIVVK